jgi:hypothetical protein
MVNPRNKQINLRQQKYFHPGIPVQYASTMEQADGRATTNSK